MGVLRRDVAAATRAQADDDARLARIVGGAVAASGGAALTWLALRRVLGSKIVMVAIGTAAVTGAAAFALSRGSDSGARVASTTPSTDSRRAASGPATVSATEDASPTPEPAELTPSTSAPSVSPTPVDRVSPTPSLANDPEAPARSRSDARARPRATPEVEPETAIVDAEPTAIALLERATRERKAGNVAAATSTYEELARRFPDSRENAVGCVAQGRMQLASKASAALATFDRCLREHPSGSLAEQAMVGRADALDALGRDADARAAWRALLERFPDTLHRDRAKPE